MFTTLISPDVIQTHGQVRLGERRAVHHRRDVCTARRTTQLSPPLLQHGGQVCTTLRDKALRYSVAGSGADQVV
jgi:hypothetical protein